MGLSMYMSDAFCTDKFCFRVISQLDFEYYRSLFLDVSIIQWIFEDDMKEQQRENLLNSQMNFYWDTLMYRKNSITYSVFGKDSLEFIGEICLYRNDEELFEMGISILKKFRNRGIGRTIINEWSQWLAETKGIMQLEIHIDD